MASDHWYADLPFRGLRTYVHSTSLCNHLARRFPDAARFDLTIRTWMAGRILFAPAGAIAGAKGGFRVTDANGGERDYAFTDDTTHPVTEREPYDEPAAVADAAIADRVLTSERGSAGATFFDRLVAGNKVLIERALSPGVRLIATRIATPGFPHADQPFQLSLDQHLGTRIFRSALLIDGTKRGEVVFYGQ